MWRLREAIRFLTVLRLPGGGPPEGAAISELQRWLPAVGAGIGALAAGVAWALADAPDRLQAACAVAAAAALTGALHWDGLADSADAFFSGRPRERMLEILKDSRIGTMGAMALVIALLLQVELIAAIPPPDRYAALIAAPAAARWAVVLGAWRGRYARAEGGTGSAFIGAVAPESVGVATAWAIGLALLTCGAWAPAVLAAAAAATAAVSAYANAKIGGVTGDVLGAGEVLAEIAVLAALSVR